MHLIYCKSMFAVPDQLVILVDFLDPVQRHRMDNPVMIHNLEGITVVGRENQIGKRDPDNFRQNPVVITDLKIATSELLVPPDAAEQFMDGDHGQFFSSSDGEGRGQGLF